MNVEDQMRAAITQQADSYEVPPPDIDGFTAGALRRRRRHRVVSAVAACAVLGIVASGLVSGRTMRDTGGPTPADQPNPTKSLRTDDRVGFVGPPPPGTPPTGPATGELVAEVHLYSSGTWVYADGRIINAVRNFGTSDQFRGFVVRQLTPSGVEAMRSFLDDGTRRLTPVAQDHAGDLDHPGDMGVRVRHGGRLMLVQDFEGCETTGADTAENWLRCPRFTDPDWLPASAWQDPAFRPFVPHSYEVCLGSAPPRSSPAEILPAEAVDLLLGPESPLADRLLARAGLCRELATPVASELADVMDQAGPAYVRQEEGNYLSYALPSSEATSTRTDPPHASLEFWFVLPHGGFFCPCG